VPGIAAPTVVDLVSLSPDAATCLLHIIEVEQWGKHPNPENLNAKLMSYIAFALDGQLVATYPEVEGLQVAIEIDCYFRLARSAESDLRAVKQLVASYGIDLRWVDGMKQPK
jgi:hypothetical protein